MESALIKKEQSERQRFYGQLIAAGLVANSCSTIEYESGKRLISGMRLPESDYERHMLYLCDFLDY